MSAGVSAAAWSSLNGNANGIVHPDRETREAFLDKILQIRDQVFASKHPRLTLPPHVLVQATAPVAVQNTLPPSRPATNGTSSGSQPSHALPPRPDSSFQQFASPGGYLSPAQSAVRPFSAKSASSSSIDPVLLTKSEHLIRAEIQLKRQQIERTLKDQVDQKNRSREKEVSADELGFNVETLLTRAQELVPPVSGLPVGAADNDESDSFDENSYYSSKANTWSSEDLDANGHISGTKAAEPLTSQMNPSAAEAQLTIAKAPTRPESQSREAAAPVIDLEEDYEPVDDLDIYEPEPAQNLEEQEEEEYSPPPADIGSVPMNAGRGRPTNVSRRQSPAGRPAPVSNPKKRRREAQKDVRKRQNANKRQAIARSPEPYIKEEPQSPPPFASFSDPQPSKRQGLQPLSGDMNYISVRDARAQPAYYRDGEPAMRSYRQFEEPLSPTVVRVPHRRLERDDQDLRRIASFQHARRPYSPESAVYSAAEARHSRAASHAYIDRVAEPVYRESSMRPSAVPRQIRDHSPAVEYIHRPQSPVIMAPPPRRIVVDQYGNKYYAAPVDARESVAPSGRRMETEPYYERAVTREPISRVSVRHDPYDEEDAMRMPPPPLRRYAEHQDVDMVEAPVYRQRAMSIRPVEAEHPGRELVERRPIAHYEEMGPPRGDYAASRAYSVRPEVVRREVPNEYMPIRHESVQPGYVRMSAPRYREVSVLQQDPYEDRRRVYATPSQARPYTGEESAVEVVREAYEEPRRVSYRY